MAFRPLHDRVLVRCLSAREKIEGGIIIPDTAQEKPQEGEIVAASPGARAENGSITPLDVKAGDRVMFGKWSGADVRLGGEDIIIMKESDVLGIVGWTPGRTARDRRRISRTLIPKVQDHDSQRRQVRS